MLPNFLNKVKRVKDRWVGQPSEEVSRSGAEVNQTMFKESLCSDSANRKVDLSSHCCHAPTYLLSLENIGTIGANCNANCDQRSRFLPSAR